MRTPWQFRLISTALKQAWRYLEDNRKCSRVIREIFFALADGQPSPQNSGDDHSELDVQPVHMPSAMIEEDVTALGDLIPVDWRARLLHSTFKLPLSFLQQLLEFVLSLDEQGDSCFGISWLELLFMPLFSDGVDFPVRHPSKGSGDVDQNWSFSKRLTRSLYSFD